MNDSFFFSRYSKNQQKTSSMTTGSRQHDFIAVMCSPPGVEMTSEPRRKRRREKEEKKVKGESCRMERRQSSLAIFTLCGNHVFNLTYRNCASGLLLGIKKFPNEKLALDDFGKALKASWQTQLSIGHKVLPHISLS